ncbi:MAG TPA: hypothetical protein VGQ11_13340 [Candidatus Acidoferrales bacterium]|jgi:hypothetical protein|nr:hypothetical protein [Candidatus Acidoferrales bacterium]
MRIYYSDRFRRSYLAAPSAIQNAFDKQVQLLLQNPRHPSLRVKKYDASRGIWQARVTRSWRFYFSLEGEVCLLHDIMSHPK